MQTATATVAGRRRVSFTLPEPRLLPSTPRSRRRSAARARDIVELLATSRTVGWRNRGRRPSLISVIRASRGLYGAGPGTGAGRGPSARGGGRGSLILLTRWSRSRCVVGSRRRTSFCCGAARSQFFGQLGRLFKRAVRSPSRRVVRWRRLTLNYEDRPRYQALSGAPRLQWLIIFQASGQ